MRIEKYSNLIDIGCGAYKKEGYVGIDKKDFGQEIVWDIRNGIPLPDKSVTDIYTSHFIEHLTRSELEPFIEEVKRVLSGKIVIIVPHKDTSGAYDYAHRSFWGEKEMISFLSSAGFSILEINERDGNLITIASCI